MFTGGTRTICTIYNTFPRIGSAYSKYVQILLTYNSNANDTNNNSTNNNSNTDDANDNDDTRVTTKKITKTTILTVITIISRRISRTTRTSSNNHNMNNHTYCLNKASINERLFVHQSVQVLVGVLIG